MARRNHRLLCLAERSAFHSQGSGRGGQRITEHAGVGVEGLVDADTEGVVGTRR